MSFLNRARATNPYNPANPAPPPPPPRDSVYLPAYTDEQIAWLRKPNPRIQAPIMPVPVSRDPGVPVPAAYLPGPAPVAAPAPVTVLHIGNQAPNALATRNIDQITAMVVRKAELADNVKKDYSGPNTLLGKIMNVIILILLYRFQLGLIDYKGRLLDSEGCLVPRPPPTPPRKRRYTEPKKSKKVSSRLRNGKATQNRFASSLMSRMKDQGKLSFAATKNWKEFKQIPRFRNRIDFQDMIERGNTYKYEREKKQFYSDPKNLDKPFHPRFLPIVVSKTRDIDDWRIKTGPNGQLIQPQIVMPSLTTNNNGATSSAMDTNDAATEVDDDADDIGMANFDDDDEIDLPPLPPRPGFYEFIPMTFRPPRYVPPPPMKGTGLPLAPLFNGKSDNELLKGKFKAHQPAVDDPTGWEAAFCQVQVWYNPRSTLNIEEGLVPPRQYASRDPPPSPPGYSHPVPVPSPSAARNQAPSPPPAPLRRRDPERSTPVASGSGSQQPVRRAPLQPVSQTQLPATQPTSSQPPQVISPSLLSRLSPPDVRQEASYGDENAGPGAHSAFVETPTAPSSPEATVTSFANASSSNFQQPVPAAAYTAPVSPPNIFAPNAFTNATYSSVQEPQIPVAASAFPPSSQNTQSSSINIDNIMGWATETQPAAPTSWASLAAQAPTTSWWGTQAFQEPAHTPSIFVDDQPMDTSASASYQTPLEYVDMNVDTDMASPPAWDAEEHQQPAFEQSAYSSNIPNGFQYQSDDQQNAFSSDQHTTWTSAPQMQPSFQQLQICYQDSNTGAWLPYHDPRLQICIFDPSSQTYIPLQLLQSPYVGAPNPLGDQTQSSWSSTHTTFDSYQQHLAEQQQQQHQSSWSSMHTTSYPSQYAPGHDQQSSSSSMYTSSYPSEQYATGAQQQSFVSSMPTSSSTFAPLQSEYLSEYSSSRPVEVVQPQQPASWNQPSVEPSVAATLAACNFWGSATAEVQSQDRPATPFDSTPVATVSPPEHYWSQSEVDSSLAAPQAAYNSDASTSAFGYQDPSMLDSTFVSGDLQGQVDVLSQMEPWEAALQFNIDEEDILSDQFLVNAETARRQRAHPPPMRLRRYRRSVPPPVNNNSGTLFDPQACKQFRLDQHSFEKQGDQPRQSQTSSTPRKKRSRDESESTPTSSRRRTVDEDTEGTPSKRARRTEPPVEPPAIARTPPPESPVMPSHTRSADDELEGTGPTRSRRARRNDPAPYAPNSAARRVRWADPITTEGYATAAVPSSSRPTRSVLRKQRNAAPSKSDRFCPLFPGIGRWFNVDETRL